MKEKFSRILSLLAAFWAGITTAAGQSPPCNTLQSLSGAQQTLISNLLPQLDTALYYENTFFIDSVSSELKNAYSSQGGLPETAENYAALTSNSTWLSFQDALNLSRTLLDADTLYYSNLWKMAMGMAPPLYQPHSLPLRKAAEIAEGLILIASVETDTVRRNNYQRWAFRALDSLARMQLLNGAFPFPDLRTYNDPVFSPIIQNFLNACGPDSVNVLVNGWIIDDKNTGEFKFDAGVAAESFYKACTVGGQSVSYSQVLQDISAYLSPLKFNRNYNYNTFSILGLAEGFHLSGNNSWLDRAKSNFRNSVWPGQLETGRWMDGHNARSVYHAIMISNMVPLYDALPATDTLSPLLNQCLANAIMNQVRYSYQCNSSTGFEWIIEAWPFSFLNLSAPEIDSLSDLMGQHIQQAATDLSYLDEITLGKYLLLTDQITSVSPPASQENIVLIYPNPCVSQIHFALPDNETLSSVSLFSVSGKQVPFSLSGSTLRLDGIPSGVYLLQIGTASGKLFSKKVVVSRD